MDFRVIVMHRQVIDSFLVSITVKRHFAPSFDANIVTAYQMLTYLLAQISVIDPKFIAGCFHLDMDKEEFSQVRLVKYCIAITVLTPLISDLAN